MVLDWLNGNRSVLVDAELSGMILGMTLQTKPEDIYRAMIEATAYGQRMIFEAFAEKQDIGTMSNLLNKCVKYCIENNIDLKNGK